jgi:hypothetical protein
VATDIPPNATPTFDIFLTGSAAGANSPGIKPRLCDLDRQRRHPAKRDLGRGANAVARGSFVSGLNFRCRREGDPRDADKVRPAKQSTSTAGLDR